MHIWLERYQQWLHDPYFDLDTREELARLATLPDEQEDRFYKGLEFGTGGLRGLIGAGTNRMNRYTVRLATRGLANYIAAQGPAAMSRGVVIAHDSRRFSAEFAHEAACTLAASRIPAYLWNDLRPTPLLSFAVRELGATAGIVITASHNPPEYNGYKVYWAEGGQVPPDRAAAIQAEIQALTDITAILPVPEETARANDLVRTVHPDVDEAYFRQLLTLVHTTREQRSACSILYSPLHGSGNLPVRRVLTDAGFLVSVVKDQERPDPDFATVRSPNPEEIEVFTLALQQAQFECPDIIMATDPDADRLGVLVRDGNGHYRPLSGHQVGTLLVDYVLSQRKAAGAIPANGAVIKTIATSNLAAGICQEHGVSLLNTHTGFKYIGDKIQEFERTGSHVFLFGFEESCGYLGASFVRDKDATMAALMVADATAYHKAQGRTLLDALHSLWERYGYFQEGLYGVTLQGKKGQEKIRTTMEALRLQPPGAFAGIPVVRTDDYLVGQGIDHRTGSTYALNLGKADALHYSFDDGGFVLVRPSGTEPKLKLYVSVRANGVNEAMQQLHAVKASALDQLRLG